MFIAGSPFRELKDSHSLFLRTCCIILSSCWTKTVRPIEFLHQVFQQHQLDLVPEIELTSNDLLVDLARIGLGIAFVPDYCITEQSDNLFLLKTKEELPFRELAVAYNDQLPLSRASMEFLSYFQNDSM